MGKTLQRLLCIDNHASRNLAVFLLEQANYEVVTADSVSDGLKLAKSAHFDLFLLNHQLLNGAERQLCHKLKSFAPRTPILFYSTVTYPYHQRRARRGDIHRHTMGPVEISEVVNSVSQLLGQQRKHAEDAFIQHKGGILTAVCKVLAAVGIGAAAMATMAMMQARNSGLSGKA